MTRMGLRFFGVAAWLALGVCTAFAQSPDSVFTYDEFIAQVLAGHPAARQAELQQDFADAEWLAAQGHFDPVVSSGWNEKNFDKKLYYRQYAAQARVPTGLGVDVVGGYENTTGVFLNPESSTSTYGLWNLGVEANVLQGFRVNERNTARQQARIAQDIAENQSNLILNNLLYDATIAYLDWQQYYHIQQVLGEGILLAEQYLENTRTSFVNGEKTAMDTLEARILRQDRLTAWQENSRYLAKSRQNLEIFLWGGNGEALQIKPESRPLAYDQPLLQAGNNPDDIQQAMASHPLIVEKVNKRASLEVEQRLKREKLKPKLKVKFQPLLHTDANVLPGYSVRNFKWGFDFSMPLLMRSERAELEKNKLKIQQVDLELQDKGNEIRNKLEASMQQQIALLEQLSLQERNLAGYQALLEAENEKFRFGESSVFLLNKRQEKYLDGQIKWIKLHIKYQAERLNYLYLSNRLL